MRPSSTFILNRKLTDFIDIVKSTVRHTILNKNLSIATGGFSIPHDQYGNAFVMVDHPIRDAA